VSGRVPAFTLALLALTLPVLAQMPDPRAMSGMSMPAPDLPDGTVSVRLVRGQITNNLTGVAIELHGAGDVRRATTGADGRAIFSGLPPGASVHAVAIVDGERLESRPIEVPVKGGMRTLLAASGPAAGTPAGSGSGPAGAVSSDVNQLALGTNSRIATEFSDDVLQVFLLLEVVNRSSTPVTPSSALVFDMPTGAEGTTLLEGSTTLANAKGPRVTLAGSIPPGSTPLQIAYRIDTSTGTLTLAHRFPLPLESVSIAVQKVGDMQVRSAQVARTMETPLDRSTFVVGTGPRLAAGQPLTLELSGLPHASRVPVYVALALAGVIVAAAGWLAFAPRATDAASNRRRELLAEREQGLAALASLEQQHRAGIVDEDAYGARRATLMSRLERVYGELDEGGGTPGGQGVAA
jgi:hypothetical protein